MDRKVRIQASRYFVTLVASIVLLSCCGCIGLTSVLIHAWSGHLVEPAFDGLDGRQVAVVCVSDSTGLGPSSAESRLAYAVESMLRKNVPEIEVISQRSIDDWKDRNDWDGFDVLEIGDGVGAELVVAIQLNSFRLHEGQTMYKGRAEIATIVYDIARDGEEVYSTLSTQFVFPTNGAYGATDTTDAKFSRQFIYHLARQVAKNFYAYDIKEDFASDSSLVTQ